MLDSSSLTCIEQAKKGKRRKFAMISKGTQIVSLIVFRKGPVERYRKQAKQSGTGAFCHGTIEGKGLNLIFKLARADGFTAEPVRTKALKDYLAANTPFQFKPTFEIVDAPQLVLDGEDPNVQRLLDLQQRVESIEDPVLAEKLVEACRGIELLLDADESEQAAEKLQKLEQALSSQAAPAADSLPASADDEALNTKEVVARIEQVTVDVDAAIRAEVSAAADAERLLAEARQLAEAGDLSAAASVLDDLEKLLKAVAWRVELENSGQARSLKDIKAELEPKLNKIWAQRSKTAITQLTKLDKVFQSSEGKLYVLASRKLNTVLRRLKEAPTNPNQAAAMRNYLEQDAAANCLDEDFKFKKPLLKVLAGVDQAFDLARKPKS